MAKRKLIITATYKFEIEVDTENPIVMDYCTQEEMIEDLVSYRFKTLPVIGNGVEIKDVEVQSFEMGI